MCVSYLVIALVCLPSVLQDDAHCPRSTSPEIDENAELIHNLANRFEREGLLKYDALRGCSKKLALSMNITGIGLDIGEEYIPIEHVFDGPQHRRVRLLDPYVLRMRRSPPLLAYKLHYTGTVNVMFADLQEDFDRREDKINRFKRHEYNVVVEKVADQLDKELIPENKHLHKNYLNKNYIGNQKTNTENDIVLNKRYNQTESSKTNKDSIPFDNNNDSLYSLYNIGSKPELWHSLQIGLLQKTVDSDGETVWNDVTAGDNVTVGTTMMQWNSDGMTVRYRYSSSISRRSVLSPGLSLLNKMQDSPNFDTAPLEDYIIIPTEDIVNTEEKDGKRDSKLNSYKSSKDFHKNSRRVVVRSDRAIHDTRSMNVVEHGRDLYLTMAHTSPLQAQVDIEARADDNEIIRVGSSARISTIVSDNTRNTRTILTIHAGNTGLAAARFRASVRDCGQSDKELASTAPTIIPPGHTERMLLQIPREIHHDLEHCTVSLVNNDEESIAVRDVSIRKGDRCFCVWHCSCVCLGLDPRLECGEMSPAQLFAAGIGPHDRPRPQRCVTYPDSAILNWFIAFFGVLFVLMFIGLGKACVGIAVRGVGMWGLDRVVVLPRQLGHYHEPWLRMRRVVYDGQGWPLHPDSKRRTVRVLSFPMEFILNIMLPILLPCLLFRDAFLSLPQHWQHWKNHTKRKSRSERLIPENNNNEVTKPKTVKSFKHDEKYANKAKQVAGNLTKSTSPKGNTRLGPLCPCDSDHDDTAYVLTQMEKSKESLAVSIFSTHIIHLSHAQKFCR